MTSDNPAFCSGLHWSGRCIKNGRLRDGERGSPTLGGGTVGRHHDTPTLNRYSGTCLMRIQDSRPRRGWLLLAVLLPLLCLAGCAARASRSPARDRAVAASPTPMPPVATFTPVPTPSPTVTPTSTPRPTLSPTPTLLPTPTSTPTFTGPPTSTPSLTVVKGICT